MDRVLITGATPTCIACVDVAQRRNSFISMFPSPSPWQFWQRGGKSSACRLNFGSDRNVSASTPLSGCRSRKDPDAPLSGMVGNLRAVAYNASSRHSYRSTAFKKAMRVWERKEMPYGPSSRGWCTFSEPLRHQTGRYESRSPLPRTYSIFAL